MRGIGTNMPPNILQSTDEAIIMRSCSINLFLLVVHARITRADISKFKICLYSGGIGVTTGGY